eukprot:196088-Amphidinium_carterae.1
MEGAAKLSFLKVDASSASELCCIHSYVRRGDSLWTPLGCPSNECAGYRSKRTAPSSQSLD